VRREARERRIERRQRLIGETGVLQGSRTRDLDLDRIATPATQHLIKEFERLAAIVALEKKSCGTDARRQSGSGCSQLPIALQRHVLAPAPLGDHREIKERLGGAAIATQPRPESALGFGFIAHRQRKQRQATIRIGNRKLVARLTIRLDGEQFFASLIETIERDQSFDTREAMIFGITLRDQIGLGKCDTIIALRCGGCRQQADGTRLVTAALGPGRRDEFATGRQIIGIAGNAGERCERAGGGFLAIDEITKHEPGRRRGTAFGNLGQQISQCPIDFDIGLDQEIAIHLARNIEPPGLERHEADQAQGLHIFAIEFEQPIRSLRGGRQIAAGPRHLERTLDGSRIAIGEPAGEITVDGAFAIPGQQSALGLAAIGGLQRWQRRRQQQQEECPGAAKRVR